MARAPFNQDIRRFYERGGYIKRKETPSERRQRIDMALYGTSQWDRPEFDDGGRVPAVLAASPLSKLVKAFRAYHGSPHEFDRFDARKIGSGEGAQMFGHGHYFAENE